jgi:hypothetical protein
VFKLSLLKRKEDFVGITSCSNQSSVITLISPPILRYSPNELHGLVALPHDFPSPPCRKLLLKGFYRLSSETIVIEKRIKSLHHSNYGLPVLFNLVFIYVVTITICT